MQKNNPCILSLQNVSKIYRSNTNTPTVALNNISLNIHKGEFVVIIGKNGCGKSTLIKTISAISKPSKGQVSLFGTLTAINDWGSGVETEISGYDNIRMIGKINRFSNSQINELKQFVEEFSNLGDKLFEPVKNYSQGMYLRLAFSINAFLSSDILVFDEILAVGDIQFREKCYAWLETMSEEGKTIIVATHSFEEFANKCNRAIWLHEGKVMLDGNPSNVYKEYIKFIHPFSTPANTGEMFKVKKEGIINIKKIFLRQDGILIDSPVFWKDTQIIIEWEKMGEPCGITFTLFISDGINNHAILSLSDNYGIDRKTVETINKVGAGIYHDVVTITGGLLNIGMYNLYLVCSHFTSESNDEIIVHSSQIYCFEVVDDPKHRETYIWKYSQAPLRIKNSFNRFSINS